jgi:hypothetical protein
MWILLDTPELTCDAGCRCRCCLLRGQAIARTGDLSSCDQCKSQKQAVPFDMIREDSRRKKGRYAAVNPTRMAGANTPRTVTRPALSRLPYAKSL